MKALTVPVAMLLALGWGICGAKAEPSDWLPSEAVVAGDVSQAEIECLALNIYWEARSEPREGQLAVASVTLNRVLDPAYPNSICEVVYQGDPSRFGQCQFSWWCDGRSDVPKEAKAWERSLERAIVALKGQGLDPSGGALFYHHHAVQPYWSSKKQLIARIGQHLYYR